ncbi:tetratricopeptide repeat protein [bacterium]|nr:tetratricopeptide repeat protein [bacterium]
MEIKQQAEFDRLMTAAHVHRRRGDYDEAERTIKQALEISPDDLDAREFAADMLFARGKLEEAVEAYKAIMSADKSRASAEEKYAKTILQIAEGKRQQDLLKDMLENPKKYRSRQPARSPAVAAILSIAPGFGQIYNGQFVRGVVIFVVTMVFWLFFYLLTPDVSTFPTDKRLTAFIQNLPPLAVVFALVAVFLQVYAFVDAPVCASKQKEEQNAQNQNRSEPD